MKKSLKAIGVAILCASFASGCQNIMNLFFKVGDVYVSGINVVDKSSQPGYWKNGTWNNVTSDFLNGPWVSGEGSEQLCVAGGDVYMAGQNGYWKNGVWQALDSPQNTIVPNYANVDAIRVSGSDVYCCGTKELDSVTINGILYQAVTVAFEWKNGKCVRLDGTDSLPSRVECSLLVDGSDVYVGGFGMPGYWKNEVWVPLPAQGKVLGLAKSGDDLYVVGMDSSGAYGYWKNGTWVNLSQSLPVNPETVIVGASCVSGSDFYLAGLYQTGGLQKAGYWKNGTWNSLGGDDAIAVAVAVSGSTVLVAGEQWGSEDIGGGYYDGISIAGYWENGVWIKLSSKDSHVFGFYVSGE
jgi:hypothetical protein